MESTKPENHESVIFVNKKQIRVDESSLTGRQILERAGYDPNQYDLFLVHGQTNQKIGLDEPVHIENGLHFNAILRNVPYGGHDDP
jgi:hypothetical protein